MKLLDRMMLRGYFQAYGICFFSLVSLYVVVDLFSKLDEFTEDSRTLPDMLETMGAYYACQLSLIFDRLCGTIVQLSAMFTMAWMQRNNELLPFLSAGVSTRRVLLPVCVGTALMLGVSMVNREVLMPSLADQLKNPAEDPLGKKEMPVTGAYEPNDILITGIHALREERRVTTFTCTIPEKIAGGLFHLSAAEARYIPKGPELYSGGWLMTGTAPAELPLKWKDPVLKQIEPGKLFLYTEHVDFELVTRHRSWYQYASVWELFRELEKSESTRLATLAVQLHLRLTMPLLTFIMVLMGLAVLLRDQGRNVILSAGLCLLLAGFSYAVGYLGRHLGEAEYLSPTLAAWMPVFFFGPLSIAMLDAVHT